MYIVFFPSSKKHRDVEKVTLKKNRFILSLLRQGLDYLLGACFPSLSRSHTSLGMGLAYGSFCR